MCFSDVRKAGILTWELIQVGLVPSQGKGEADEVHCDAGSSDRTMWP